MELESGVGRGKMGDCGGCGVCWVVSGVIFVVDEVLSDDSGGLGLGGWVCVYG